MSRNDNLNQFDDLIDELRQDEERPSIPPTFKSDLRSQLLNQYKQPRFSWGNLRQSMGTAVALALLAIAVLSIQQILSNSASVAGPVSVTRPAISVQADVIYDHLLISWLTPDGTAVELTAESWQTVDGRQFRGQVTDADGNLLHFAQSDGITLWRSFQAQSDPGWYPINQIYQTSAVGYHPPQGAAVPEWVTTPPFYSGLAWEGLVSKILQPDWNCTDFPCVIEQLRNPALGVNPADVETENYGWGGSLIDTEIGEDGRSISTLSIGFAPRELEGEAAAQHRLVKVDSETFTVREVTDFDDETMTRRLQRLERQTLTPDMLPDGFFSIVPDGLLVVPWQPQTVAEDRVWLINASPAPGTNLSSLPNRPTTIEMEIGYELSSAPEALVFVEVLPGDWSAESAGFPPYLGSSGTWISISAQDSSVTIPVQLNMGIEPAPASIIADVKLILREPQTAYFFHQQTLSESGWLLAEDGAGTAVAQSEERAANDVWLISAIQQARTSANAPITLEITVGYQFESDEEVLLKSLYANPNWESASGGRIPIDGLSDAITLTEKSGTQTITFSESPAVMRQIVGTDQPVLVMQIGYLSEGENSRNELKILAMPTITDFAIDLTSTEEISYQSEFNSPDQLTIVNVSPPIGSELRGSTTFTVTVAYDLASLNTASLNTSLLPFSGGAAVWINDEQIISMGDGELTYSFKFEPLDNGAPSDWLLTVQLADPSQDPSQPALASASPHINITNDAYHFEP